MDPELKSVAIETAAMHSLQATLNQGYYLGAKQVPATKVLECFIEGRAGLATEGLPNIQEMDEHKGFVMYIPNDDNSDKDLKGLTQALLQASTDFIRRYNADVSMLPGPLKKLLMFVHE